MLSLRVLALSDLDLYTVGQKVLTDLFKVLSTFCLFFEGEVNLAISKVPETQRCTTIKRSCLMFFINFDQVIQTNL